MITDLQNDFFSPKGVSWPLVSQSLLLASAPAGCFSMALAAELSKAGFTPEHIHTKAKVQSVQRDGGWIIPRIVLETEAVVPNIAAEMFEMQAETVNPSGTASRARSR